MKTYLIRALASAVAAALIVAGVATAGEKPVVVRAGNLILTLNGGVTPQALPKNTPAPIGFHVSGNLATADGTHPPAFKESTFDVDKDVSVDVTGIAVCHRAQLVAQDTAHARHACSAAILGEGDATVEVSFPEQGPIESTGPLVLYNGGVRRGVTTLFLHAYVDIPAPTAAIATLTVTKENKGPYGLRFVSSIPVLAGGNGSVTHFDLHSDRFLTNGGERHSFLFAKCSDGLLLVHGSVKFRDGSILTGGVARTCKAAG